MVLCCCENEQKKGMKKAVEESFEGETMNVKRDVIDAIQKMLSFVAVVIAIVLGCSSSLPRRKDPLCLENVKYGTHQLIISRSYLTSINPII